MTFTVTYAQRGDIAWLHLTGELDMSTAPELNAIIDRLLSGGQCRLLVDLQQTTFCDSTGMSAFVRGDNHAAAGGGWLRLTGASGRVARVLQISGLWDVLRYQCEPDDTAALNER